MTIGFDLDGVFIDRPFFIPRRLLEWLYRGPQHNGPSYRFPKTRLEQFIRRVSHYYLLRPKVTSNIAFLHRLMAEQPRNNYFLISSRYHFLEKPTRQILNKYGLNLPELRVHLNNQNMQPHLFKKEAINRLKLDLFIDDDLRTVRYLSDNCPGTTTIWYNPGAKMKTSGNIQTISKLTEATRFIKQR